MKYFFSPRAYVARSVAFRSDKRKERERRYQREGSRGFCAEISVNTYCGFALSVARDDNAHTRGEDFPFGLLRERERELENF